MDILFPSPLICVFCPRALPRHGRRVNSPKFCGGDLRLEIGRGRALGLLSVLLASELSEFRAELASTALQYPVKDICRAAQLAKVLRGGKRATATTICRFHLVGLNEELNFSLGEHW
jgi:hypothetical protein